MTTNVHKGRFTARAEGDFVVFLIGMRFNKPWKVRQWWQVVSAMPRMLRVIDQHPELGCLGYHQWLGRTTILVAYWRSFEDLDRFSRDKDLPHLQPWRRFNRAIRDSGDVGIWHETFKVRAGDYEAVYGNMPAFGLAAAAEHVPVGRVAQSAAARIGATETDAPVVDPY
jgi:Monooxygenase af470-like